MNKSKQLSQTKNRKNWPKFLKDVLICSLGAYGGPEAHYGIFTDQMVIKSNYLKEEELLELMALTAILPGPSSTQTLVSIAYKYGGPILALLTLLVWALPVVIIMTLLSFLGDFLFKMNISQDSLRYIGPMAVGFIGVAAYRLGGKVIRNRTSLLLFIFGSIATYRFRQIWVYPLVLVIGGLVSIRRSKEEDLWNHVRIDPPWKYFNLFLFFALGAFFLNRLFDNIIIELFESFYRYGYLVIGGGQVVIPLMHSELVEIGQYMTKQEFLTGYGLVQGLPGPMFSFAAYAGGMAARGLGPVLQVVGALTSGLAIFLPGVLLIFFVYPVWEGLKEIKAIRVSLDGITAVAGGLIATTAIILLQDSGLGLDNLLISTLTVLALASRRIPAPFLVLASLVLGFVF